MFKNSRRTCQNPSEPGAILGIPEPLLTFPEPGSLCKDPIAFCRWGKRVICNPQKFHHPHLQTSAATPQKLQLQHLFFLGRKSLPFYCPNLRFHHQAGITTSRLNADGASSKFWCCAITKADCKAWRRSRSRGIQGVAMANGGVFGIKKCIYTYTRAPKDFLSKQGI